MKARDLFPFADPALNEWAKPDIQDLGLNIPRRIKLARFIFEVDNDAGDGGRVLTYVWSDRIRNAWDTIERCNVTGVKYIGCTLNPEDL